MRRIATATVAVVLIGAGGCDRSGPLEPTAETRIVQDHLAECTGVGVQLCLLVREASEEQFGLFYDGIGGFEYDWGYVYEVEVDRYPVPDPPIDGSSIRTELRRVLAKERVPPGTRFEIFLPPELQIEEVGQDRYRFYDAAEFVCPPGASCDELREQIAAGVRLWSRLEHPNDPQQPLILVEWAHAPR